MASGTRLAAGRPFRRLIDPVDDSIDGALEDLDIVAGDKGDQGQHAGETDVLGLHVLGAEVFGKGCGSNSQPDSFGSQISPVDGQGIMSNQPWKQWINKPLFSSGFEGIPLRSFHRFQECQMLDLPLSGNEGGNRIACRIPIRGQGLVSVFTRQTGNDIQYREYVTLPAVLGRFQGLNELSVQNARHHS